MKNTSIAAKNLSKYFLLSQTPPGLAPMLKSLAKRQALFKKHQVLNDVSFQIQEGDKVALVGKNGSGKTTLLRILAGIYRASSGKIEMHETPDIVFQDWIDLNSDVSVVDNIYLLAMVQGISKVSIRGQIDNILDFAELQSSRQTPLKHISIGQQQRLILSVFIHAPSNILFFDDCFQAVDTDFQKKFDAHFYKYLKEKTCIITSHDRDLLIKHCEKALWLEDGTIRLFDGIHKVLSAYQESSLAPAALSRSR